MNGRFDRELVPDLVNYYYLLQTVIELSEMIAAIDQSSVDKTRAILGLRVPPEERFALFKRLEVVTVELQPIAQDLVNRLEGVA